MGRIEELVRELCPDGAEYRVVRACFTLRKVPAKVKRKDYVETGAYPVVDQGQEIVSGYTDDENALLEAAPRIIFGDHTCAIKYVDFAFAQGADGVKILEPKEGLDPRFAYHVLCGLEIPSRGYSRHWSALSELSIPLPSLESQREIARVLDAYTDLEQKMEANLQREFDARKQQYEHYLNELLMNGNAVSTKPLGEISVNRNGLRRPITKGNRVAGCTPYYGASGIVDYVEGCTHSGDFLLVSEDGANLRARSYPIAFQIHGENWVNNHAHVLEVKNPATRKLIEYYLNSISLEPYISGAAQPKLTKQKLNSIEIPFPELAVQEEIVAKLDALSEQQHLIESNLLREIEARRKQYKHYRDALLDLPRKES